MVTSKPNGLTKERMTALTGCTGIHLLRHAWDCAAAVGQDVWQFALEINVLRETGLANNDLRLLLSRHLLQHGDETTRPSDPRRRFRKITSLMLARRDCFVLTKTGYSCVVRAVRAGCTPSGETLLDDQSRIVSFGTLPAHKDVMCQDSINGTTNANIVPSWNSNLHELRLGTRVIKRFTHPAPSQERILSAFEEEQWPSAIDDPLPVQFNQDPRRRLHYTIQNLNRAQKPHRLRFFINGNGQSVRWELVSPRNQRASDGLATRKRR